MTNKYTQKANSINDTNKHPSRPVFKFSTHAVVSLLWIHLSLLVFFSLLELSILCLIPKYGEAIALIMYASLWVNPWTQPSCSVSL